MGYFRFGFLVFLMTVEVFWQVPFSTFCPNKNVSVLNIKLYKSKALLLKYPFNVTRITVVSNFNISCDIAFKGRNQQLLVLIRFNISDLNGR